MPKENRSSVVSIYNVWGVKGDASEKSHKIRFRDEKSSDGWATAFIPKCDSVVIEEQAKRNLFKLTVTDENLKVKVRRKTDYSFTESEMPIRAPLGETKPGFKELYEKSRALAKADKETKDVARRSRYDTSTLAPFSVGFGDDFEF